MFKPEGKIIEVEQSFMSNELTIRVMNKDYPIYTYSVPQIKFARNPTGNCQIFCAAYFESILNYIKFAKQPALIRQILKITLRYITKKILLIDIHQKDSERAIKLLEPYCKHIVSRTPYDSTNGSKMEVIMFALDFDKISKIRKY